jgi:hypothetical protein
MGGGRFRYGDADRCIFVACRCLQPQSARNLDTDTIERMPENEGTI